MAGRCRSLVVILDGHKLAHKIDLAMTVLRDCLLELSSSPEHLSERQRMEDALRT